MATNTVRKVVEQRGDHNVPKRYLKAAKWTPEDDLPCGEGYYVIDPDNDKDGWIPVDFDFEALQWGTTQRKSTGQFEITRLAPVDHGLRIFEEERVWDRSRWGPIDVTTDSEEGPVLRFGSDKGDSPDTEADVPISLMDKDEKTETALADLAGLIPSHFNKPQIPSNQVPTSLMGTMAHIAATTTVTSTIARTTGPGISTGATPSSGGIWDSIKQDLTNHRRN